MEKGEKRGQKAFFFFFLFFFSWEGSCPPGEQ